MIDLLETIITELDKLADHRHRMATVDDYPFEQEVRRISNMLQNYSNYRCRFFLLRTRRQARITKILRRLSTRMENSFIGRECTDGIFSPYPESAYQRVVTLRNFLIRFC